MVVAASTQHVPAVSLVREELHLLDGVINGLMRRRVYRHHLFFQKVIALHAALRKSLPHLSRCTKSPREGVTVVMVKRLLSMTIGCAEAAVLELNASRVDTISLAALVLAIMSRIGCVFASLSGCASEVFSGLVSEKEKFLVTWPKGPQKRLRSGDDDENDISAIFTSLRHPTLGAVFEAAVR